VILGIGGVRALRALGAHHLRIFHMNEGHAALLTLELLREYADSRGPGWPLEDGIAAVRRLGIFTTHTPIKAGHDEFSRELVEHVVGDMAMLAFAAVGRDERTLNMSRLAIRMSRYVNGVSLKHGEVARAMFPGVNVDSITNGVHAAWWASPQHRALFDRWCPLWREDPSALRTASSVPHGEIVQSHLSAKRALMQHVEHAAGIRLDEALFTIGFARRSTTYKRPELLLSDPDRLRAIARRFGGLQILYGGKAHPRDLAGKEIIQRITGAVSSLRPEIQLVYLPDYDMRLGRLMTAGADLWVNTPVPPFEASGTSGMKAAVNGVPSLSIRDGWWNEGCIEGVTGWAIGEGPEVSDRSADAASLYDKLEHDVLPAYFGPGDQYPTIMRQAIAINGAYFNTHRMMEEYAARAYRSSFSPSRM
jgi:glycogen phosphorylase